MTLNGIDCPTGCGTKARVTASSSGTLTVFCGTCKFQGFAKSPKAIAALQARIGGTPPAEISAAGRPAGRPADKSAGKSWLEDL